MDSEAQNTSLTEQEKESLKQELLDPGTSLERLEQILIQVRTLTATVDEGQELEDDPSQWSDEKLLEHIRNPNNPDNDKIADIILSRSRSKVNLPEEEQ
jgi:hypothetical protein